MVTIDNPRELAFTSKAWHNDLKQWLGADFKNKRLLHPEKLEFKPINAGEFNIKPKFIAVDTETYHSNANLICLSNSENHDTLYGTSKEMPEIEDYFKYFQKLVTSKNTYFVAWNLSYDARIILKSLNMDLEKFYEGEDGDKLKITLKNNIKITYLNKKCLTISKNHTTVKIYDALQFFVGAGIRSDGSKGSSALDDVARAYLGEQKEYTGKYQDKSFPNKIDKKELDLIVDYCFKDCVLTKKLMDIWIDAFFANFKFYPNAFYSAGYLTAQYFKSKMENFTCFRKVPYIVQNQAWHSYFGGRFEITKRGTLKDIHHYDINSAYPYAMSIMPDFNNGRWIHITTIEEWKKLKEYVGFYKIEVDVKEKILTPFMVHQTEGQVIAPRGHIITNTTAKELEIAYKYYDFDLLRVEGFCFIPNSKEKNEFNILIENMYQARLKQKNEGQKYVYKILINSGYGKFAQSKPEPKGLFNPVVCSYITGYCRAMLLEACAKNKNNIVMLATDGIFSEKPLDIEVSKKKKLGAYDYEYHPDMILIQAGIYSNNTKDDLKLKTKSRGFALKVFDKKGNNEQVFNLSDYKLVLEQGRYIYKIFNRRSVALSQAVIQKAYTVQDVGKMEYREKFIDINADKKRVWNKDLKSIRDTCYSYALEEIIE